VNAGWIVLAVFIGGAIVMLATSRLRRHQIGDLGTVSHQWIAEQRLGQEHDSQR
jgi:hypothetical protein